MRLLLTLILILGFNNFAFGQEVERYIQANLLSLLNYGNALTELHNSNHALLNNTNYYRLGLDIRDNVQRIRQRQRQLRNCSQNSRCTIERVRDLLRPYLINLMRIERQIEAYRTGQADCVECMAQGPRVDDNVNDLLISLQGIQDRLRGRGGGRAAPARIQAVGNLMPELASQMEDQWVGEQRETQLENLTEESRPGQDFSENACSLINDQLELLQNHSENLSGDNFIRTAVEIERYTRNPTPATRRLRRSMSRWRTTQNRVLRAQERGGSAVERVDLIVRDLARHEIHNYFRESTSILDLLSSDINGNCQVQTMMIASAVQQSQIQFPPHIIPGIQHFDDHIQFVLYNTETRTVYNPLGSSPSTRTESEIRAPIYRLDYLNRLATKKLIMNYPNCRRSHELPSLSSMVLANPTVSPRPGGASPEQMSELSGAESMVLAFDLGQGYIFSDDPVPLRSTVSISDRNSSSARRFENQGANSGGPAPSESEIVSNLVRNCPGVIDKEERLFGRPISRTTKNRLRQRLCSANNIRNTIRRMSRLASRGNRHENDQYQSIISENGTAFGSGDSYYVTSMTMLVQNEYPRLSRLLSDPRLLASSTLSSEEEFLLFGLLSDPSNFSSLMTYIRGLSSAGLAQYLNLLPYSIRNRILRSLGPRRLRGSSERHDEFVRYLISNEVTYFGQSGTSNVNPFIVPEEVYRESERRRREGRIPRGTVPLVVRPNFEQGDSDKIRLNSDLLIYSFAYRNLIVDQNGLNLLRSILTRAQGQERRDWLQRLCSDLGHNQFDPNTQDVPGLLGTAVINTAGLRSVVQQIITPQEIIDVPNCGVF